MARLLTMGRSRGPTQWAMSGLVSEGAGLAEDFCVGSEEGTARSKACRARGRRLLANHTSRAQTGTSLRPGASCLQTRWEAGESSALPRV